MFIWWNMVHNIAPPFPHPPPPGQDNMKNSYMPCGHVNLKSTCPPLNPASLHYLFIAFISIFWHAHWACKLKSTSHLKNLHALDVREAISSHPDMSVCLFLCPSTHSSICHHQISFILSKFLTFILKSKGWISQMPDRALYLGLALAQCVCLCMYAHAHTSPCTLSVG